MIAKQLKTFVPTTPQLFTNSQDINTFVQDHPQAFFNQFGSLENISGVVLLGGEIWATEDRRPFDNTATYIFVTMDEDYF